MAFIVGEVVAPINADSSGFHSAVQEVERAGKGAADAVSKHMDTVKKKLEDVGKGITDIGKNLSLKITAPILGAGAASFKFAADLEDAFGAADQIFDEHSKTVKDWADSLESYYGIAEGDALTYANMMGSMLKNIGGLSEEEAAKQAQSLVQLAGDLTAMYGGSTADAVRALTGSLKGNNTMLDNYGMAVNDAMVKTRALELGLVKEGEELSLSAKQAATLSLIMEQTADSQGQAAREADGASGSLRALGTELKNVSTELGQVLIPIVLPFLQTIRDLVKAFAELTPEQKKTIVVIAGIAAAVGPLLVMLGSVVSAIGAIAGVIGTVAAGPILAVVAAIAALVAGIVLLWENSEAFREGVIGVWEKVKEVALPIIEMFKNSISNFVEAIGPVWERLKQAFQDFLPILELIGIVVGTVLAAVMGIVVGVVNGIINALAPLIDAIGGLISFITNIVNAIIALFKGDFTGAWEYLKKAGEGIITFFKGLVEAIIGFIRGLVEGVVNFFKNLYHALVGGSIIPDLIKSIINWWLSLPSRLFEIAKDMINKVVTGIQERVAAVKGVVSGLISDIVKFFTDLPKKALEWGKGLIKSFVDGVKSTVGSVTSAIGGVAGKIRDFLPFSPAKEGPLRRLPDFGSYILKPIEEVERGAAVRLGRALAHAVPQIDPGSFSAHSSTSVNITHSGVISVQGINSQGELVGVVPVVIDALRNDPRLQQALNEANYRISQSRGRPLGVFA